MSGSPNITQVGDHFAAQVHSAHFRGFKISLGTISSHHNLLQPVYRLESVALRRGILFKQKMAGENVTPAIISNVFKFIEKSVGVLTLEIRDGQEYWLVNFSAIIILGQPSN